MADSVNASNFLDAYYASLANRQSRQNRQQQEADKQAALARQWQDAQTRQQAEKARAEAETMTARHQLANEQNQSRTIDAKTGMDYINAVASGIARPEQMRTNPSAGMPPTNIPGLTPDALATLQNAEIPSDVERGNPVIHLGNEVPRTVGAGQNIAPLPGADGRPTLQTPPSPAQGLGLVPLNPQDQNKVKQDILDTNAPLEADRLAKTADAAEKQKVKSALAMVDAMDKNFPGQMRPEDRAKFFALTATGHTLPEHDMSVDKVAGNIFEELQKDIVGGKDISGKLKLYKPILDHINNYKSASSVGTFAGLAHKTADEEQIKSDTNTLLDAVQRKLKDKTPTKAEYETIVRNTATEISNARKLKNSKDSGLHPDAIKHVMGDAANPPTNHSLLPPMN